MVTFTVRDSSGNALGSPVSAPVVNGAAAAPYVLPAGLAPGSYSVDAAFSGDVNLQASADTAHTLTITAAPTTTTAATRRSPRARSWETRPFPKSLRPRATAISMC